MKKEGQKEKWSIRSVEARKIFLLESCRMQRVVDHEAGAGVGINMGDGVNGCKESVDIV